MKTKEEVLGNNLFYSVEEIEKLRKTNVILQRTLVAMDVYAEQFKPKWIPVSERLPEETGRYWCYVEEQTDLGLSHYQWNCSFDSLNKAFDRVGVTHWTNLIEVPQKEK